MNEPGTKRRNFIFTMPAFRFFLFLYRFEKINKQNIIKLILSSKTNLGKLKKHKFIINAFLVSDEIENHLIRSRKKGKHLKFRENFDFNLVADSFKFLEEADLPPDKFLLAYKLNKGNLSLQGFIYKFNHLGGLYFVPLKKYNNFTKLMSIAIYNYLNSYPTEETLPFRKLMYEGLKHRYPNKQEENCTS
ncbi:hypothetical protein [Tenacibaculum maritimum]|uniref:hypothetical protein n=1 Tax=Tenacibaculum maritimum TaxID=107401 RepID=UPI00132FD7AB|nr:hypothetical protein [Tenacibaculum maritimum]